MPIDGWLKLLPEGSGRNVRADLDTIRLKVLPFLSTAQSELQIERLSLHLSGEPTAIRHAAIRYSLYVRQLDIIQQQVSQIRSLCAHHCQRPPVGCCNGEHHVLLSLTDIVCASPTQNTLHLAHVITTLQVREHEYALQQGGLVRASYCSRLTAIGCTLRLFKSPRCIHYLCPQVIEALSALHGDQSLVFLAAMYAASTQVVSCMADFTSPQVLAAAAILFGRQPT
jgi:hypothetical protein